MKLDAETGGVVRHFDTSPMKTGHGCDETETETVAGAVPAALEAVKPPQDVRTFLNWNSRSAIGYR